MPRYGPLPRRQAAFTLLELVVVLGLAGVLLAVALPAGLRALDDHRERIELSDRVRELGWLGARAADEGRYIVIGTAERPPVHGPVLAPVTAHTPPAGWRVDPVGDPIWYFPDGTCSGGTVDLARPGEPGQRIRLEPPLCRPAR